MEKLVKELFDAVETSDMSSLKDLTQRSFLEKFNDEKHYRAVFTKVGVFRLKSIKDVKKLSPVSCDVYVNVIHNDNDQEYVLKMRWIRESGYMQTDPNGEWGVNPNSFYLQF